MHDRIEWLVGAQSRSNTQCTVKAFGDVLDRDFVSERPVAAGVDHPDVVAALLEGGESLEAMLRDFQRTIGPSTPHWHHPAFRAYCANSAAGAGVRGEALTAALHVNAMLWRTGPAATELELLTMNWLRQILGL